MDLDGARCDSKLIVSWLVGSRDGGSAFTFMHDVASRIKTRVQLTTDGHRAYLEAPSTSRGRSNEAAPQAPPASQQD